MQRGGRSFFKTEQGAVSVFLLLIFLGMLMLAGLVVDISRVMVAERKVQTALNTAVRSVLADYDEELVGQYGIYGVPYTTRQAEDLQRYFLVNLIEKEETFHFLRFNQDDLKITGKVEKSLLNDGAFQEQIMEYMKYKAPVMVTQNVLDIFLKGAFGKKADLLESAQPSGKTLDSILITQVDLKKALKNATRNSAKKALDQLLDLETIEQAQKDLAALMKEYEKQLQANNRQVQEIETAVTEAWRADSDEESGTGAPGGEGNAGNTPAVKAQGGKFTLPPDLQTLKKELQELPGIIKHNRALLEQIAELEEEEQALTEEIAALAQAGESTQAAREKRKQLRAEIKALNQQLKPLPQISDLSIQNKLPPALEKTEKKAKEFLREQVEAFLGRKISAGNPVTRLITDEEFRAANNRGASQPPAQEQGMFAYDEKMAQWNEKAAGELEENVFTYLKELTATLQQIAIGGVEKIYLTEYIMDKHTFITSPTQRGHYFNKGEVEYILFGRPAERDNIFLAFLSIWQLRFAVNVVDSFFTNPAPTFLSRLGTALVEGFICATNDLTNMYAGRGAPLCDSLKTLPTRLSYSDHLRLLLLMRSEKEQLDRIRQLMQINIRQTKEDFLLKDYGTRVEATAEISIDLWFASLLQLDKFGLPQVHGNRYIIKKTALAQY